MKRTNLCRGAKLRWLKYTQHSVYYKEFDNLKQLTKQLKTPHLMLVRQLRLFIDTKGFLHCSGCIHNAPLNELAKFSYILPAKHPFSPKLWSFCSSSQASKDVGINLARFSVEVATWLPYVTKSFINSSRCQEGRYSHRTWWFTWTMAVVD